MRRGGPWHSSADYRNWTPPKREAETNPVVGEGRRVELRYAMIGLIAIIVVAAMMMIGFATGIIPTWWLNDVGG